jgi:hypothetical protein
MVDGCRQQEAHSRLPHSLIRIRGPACVGAAIIVMISPRPERVLNQLRTQTVVVRSSNSSPVDSLGL